MNLSDYQILSVIKTYIKSMRGKVDADAGTEKGSGGSHGPSSSDDGMRKMVFDRIDEIVSEKIKKHET
ncbi:MAG TPA: hypothetical protein VKF36_22955 [Syntrophorhabdales bacterium]|nr:hypothetical protein [Syntrophorhabdales bacterium]